MRHARWTRIGLVIGAAALLIGCGHDHPGRTWNVAIVQTNRGAFEVELRPESAPVAVDNFMRLARAHYYDGTIFHRVIRDFMIQGGDPTGTGTGGQSAWGHPFADEIDPNFKFDLPGRVAMANSGPNTNGSQFFITVEPAAWLDGHHTIFGEVIAGMNVVMAIDTTATGAGDRPLVPVVIQGIRIEQRGTVPAAPLAPQPR